MTLRRVTVFASSMDLASPDELSAAEQVGRTLAENGVTLVCTGHAFGPAGTVIDVARKSGGDVIGVVVADTLASNIHPDLTERRTVSDAAAQLADLATTSDALLLLPGAVGSLDEALAWLDRANKPSTPLGLLDSGGFYSYLIGTADDGAVGRFVRYSQRGAVVLTPDLRELLRRLRDYRPPETRRGHFDAEQADLV